MMRLRGDSARRYKDSSLIFSTHMKGQTRKHALRKSHCVEGRDRPISGTCWPDSKSQMPVRNCASKDKLYPPLLRNDIWWWVPAYTHTHTHVNTNMCTHTRVSDDRRYGGRNAIWHYTIRGDLTNTGPVMSEHRPWVKYSTPGWGAFSGQMQMPRACQQL